MIRVVVDTNVLVSGLLTPHGPPGRIVDALVGGLLQAVFDDRMLAEYEEVLARPRFGFDPADVAVVLDAIVQGGERAADLALMAAASLDVRLPDGDDVAFVEVALAAKADALVTGNLAHFPSDQCHGVRIVRPADLTW